MVYQNNVDENSMCENKLFRNFAQTVAGSVH